MLPVPNLDDRRFQELVDDAKRRIAHHCPEWTDHNVSDPGVTLIELFAFMTDELFYRLNRVPDRLYVTFLELLGVRLHPPAAAVAELTMRLSAPRPDAVVVPAGTEAATRRTETEEAVVFQTTRELVIPPRRLDFVMTHFDGGDPVDHREALHGDSDFSCFSAPPQPGDTLLLGLNDAAPSCVVVFRVECDVRGIGVDPTHPPVVWEAANGTGWTRCEVEEDGTGGLNRSGDVVLYVPAEHQAHLVAGVRAGWLRCRVLEPDPDYPFYSSSPVIRKASAFVAGGLVTAMHAATVLEEVLGISEGVPGQSFPLAKSPVVAGGDDFVVEVASGSGWEPWTEVDSFAGCGPGDTVVQLDRSAGVVHFPPAVREADGSMRYYGAVPPSGAPVRVPRYRTGGGPGGNVSARALSVLRSAVPFIAAVSNRRPAHGGVTGETMAEAKDRGPLALRTRDRAVTAEDYEQLARRAAPNVARVRCIPATSDDEAGGVRVLVVPAVAPDESNRLRFEDLVPDAGILAAIAKELDERRPVGARVLVEPPLYKGITVVARLVARPRIALDLLQEKALRALYGYFDPVTGGPDGKGWPFGRPVHAGEVHAVLQGLSGVELVDEVLVFAADPITGRRGEPLQKLALGPHELVFSFEHKVRVAAES